MKKEKLKKYSLFQIVTVVLIAVLIVGIIVEICILVDYKNKIARLQEELSKIPSSSEPSDETETETWQSKFVYTIEGI